MLTSENKPVWGTCPSTVSNEPNEESPSVFALKQNYPNPFNPTTTINFELPEATMVKVSVYNMIGQEVEVLVDGFKNSGVYTLNFDASDLASGIYFYRLITPKKVFTEKMLLVK
jgi:hypothetical protein